MKIPRKNIFKKMMDVRHPKMLRAGDAEEKRTGQGTSEEKVQVFARNGNVPEEPKFPWRVAALVLFVAVVFGGGFYFFSEVNAKREQLRLAEQKLADSGLVSREAGSNIFEINSISDINTKLLPLLKSGFGAYQGMTEVGASLLKLSDDLSAIQSAVAGNLAGERSGKLLSALEEAKADLTATREASDKINEAGPLAEQLNSILPENYLSLKYELRFWEQSFSSLVDWLKAPGGRKIIVFLQNSSEMRPTGGFWGSFAEINFKGGDIDSVMVRDINEVDRTRDDKIIPPKPLWLMASRFKTADANWFFNFPDSAAKAAEFMNASKLYSAGSEKVDSVFSVSPKVLSDILDITGPVATSGVILDKDNFLASIQDEVQKGHDAGSANAKNILKDIMPVILEKLKNIDSDQKNKLFNSALSWAQNKDLMAWAADQKMQSIFEAKDFSGSVYSLPQNFEGDYLAVVAANVGGAKSDYYMKQSVTLESQLNLDGTVSDKLKIVRAHQGAKAKEWWYRATNQSYLKIFIPALGKLDVADGGKQISIYQPVSFKGYSTDAQVASVELTAQNFSTKPWLQLFKESGKAVLAGWVRTDAGKTSTLSFDYSHRLHLAPADGVVYEFVYDKQSGINGDYDFAITAPVGFNWTETGSPLYEYKSSDMPARLDIKLTLKKID